MSNLTEIVVRKAVPSDASFLTEIAMRSKAHWGYSLEFLQSVRAELTIRPEYLARAPVVVAEHNGLAVGFAGLSTPEDLSHPELTFIFVEPKEIGKGIGKLLWAEVLKLARDVGLRSFKILSDPGAEPFYLRMGARRIGEAPSSVRMLPLLEFSLDDSRVTSEMAHLRQFVRDDLVEIGSWNLSTSDRLFWANLVEADVNLESKIEGWHRDPDVVPYVLEFDSIPVGYGEIWKDENEVELARLLISPSYRNQGYGKIMVKEILVEAQKFAVPIWLRVHPQNYLALNLYRRMGFSVADEQQQLAFNQNQPIQFVWMWFESVKVQK